MRKYLLLSLLLINTFQVKAQLSTNALYFDGTGDLVKIPAIPAYDFGTGSFTIEAWVRDDDPLGVTNTNFPILSNRTDTGTGGFMLTIVDGYLVFFLGIGGLGVLTVDFRGGTCHHVAITGPVNGNFLFYIDGIYSGSLFANNPGFFDLFIGNSPDFNGGPFSFHGLIKEVRLWNIARTQSEIQNNMNIILNGAANPNLVGYWRCNEVTGQVITDYSLNSNNGVRGMTANAESSDPLFTTGCPSCSPPYAVIAPSGATTFCANGNVLLTANTGTGLTHQWKKNGTNISGATSSGYTATSAGSYTVQITNSCGSSTSSPVVVTVNPNPSATITPAGPTTFCPGGNVILNGPVNINYTYVWKKYGVNISGATSSSYTATSSGPYTVRVTNTATGCSKVTNPGIVVTKNPLPAATITPAGTIVFCAGQSALLTANNGTGYTYKWKKNGNYISGATAMTYIVSTAGKYKVEVTNSYGCTKTSVADTVVVPCREGENFTTENNFDVKVYPNPSSGDFVFEIDNAMDENISIEVFDVIGKIILSETIHNSTFIIQRSTLSPGIYSAVVTAGENKKTIRIVKTD